jgi:hypothetical protein
MIRVVHPGSQIPDPDPEFLPIPDPGVKKAPDPGSGSATLPKQNYNVLSGYDILWRSTVLHWGVWMQPFSCQHWNYSK